MRTVPVLHPLDQFARFRSRGFRVNARCSPRKNLVYPVGDGLAVDSRGIVHTSIRRVDRGALFFP